MYVRHDGRAHARLDRSQGKRILFVRHRNAHDVAARILQGKNLSDALFHVARLGCRHALHGNAAAAQKRAPDAYTPDHYAFVSSSFFSIIFCSSAMNEEISLKERYTEA